MTSRMARCSIQAALMVSSFFFRDPRHLGEPVDIRFKNIQRFLVEMPDNFFGRLGSDTFDEPRSEVLFKRGTGGRPEFGGAGGSKLAAVFGVDRPGAGKFHGRPGENLGLMDDDGLLGVGVVERQDAQDRPAGIGVVIGDAFHDPPKALGDDPGVIRYGWLHKCRFIQSTCNPMIKKYIMEDTLD